MPVAAEPGACVCLDKQGQAGGPPLRARASFLPSPSIILSTYHQCVWCQQLSTLRSLSAATWRLGDPLWGVELWQHSLSLGGWLVEVSHRWLVKPAVLLDPSGLSLALVLPFDFVNVKGASFPYSLEVMFQL